MNKREQIQADALKIALDNRRSSAAVSMGVGKTLIGLKYIDHLQKANMNKLNVLVVAPKLSIFKSWKDDALKFNMDILGVEFTTYLSLNKYDPNKFDVLVLDEAHSLLNSHIGFLGHYNGRILGLTGTPPRYADSEKGIMMNTFCPVKFKYITDDAVDDDILNDYRIIVHKMRLSSSNTIKVTLKNNKEFYTSETKNYNYWTERVYEANGPKQKQIASIMRMKALMDFQTKENYANKLFQDMDQKCILFCNTQAQADRMCTHSVHSNNVDSDENLELFKEGRIERLSCVNQLNEGVNIPELRSAIIMHSFGNERKAQQKLGRLLRLNPTEIATAHILCYKDTVDEQWVNEALKDLDENKIKYFDVDDSTFKRKV
jgi:superfamily II DNA or RNA helicase